MRAGQVQALPCQDPLSPQPLPHNRPGQPRMQQTMEENKARLSLGPDTQRQRNTEAEPRGPDSHTDGRAG